MVVPLMRSCDAAKSAGTGPSPGSAGAPPTITPPRAARRQVLIGLGQVALAILAPTWATPARAEAIALPQERRVPGGVARLPLGPAPGC